MRPTMPATIHRAISDREFPALRVLIAIAAIAPLTLFAQAGPAPRDPADPAAQVAASEYQSPFAGYRPFADRGVGPWRELNDEVARIGGWRAYAREVFEANEAAKGAASPAFEKDAGGKLRDGAPRDR
jgi:hypothetical protein